MLDKVYSYISSNAEIVFNIIVILTVVVCILLYKTFKSESFEGKKIKGKKKGGDKEEESKEEEEPKTLSVERKEVIKQQIRSAYDPELENLVNEINTTK